MRIQHALRDDEFKTGPYFLAGYAVVRRQTTAFEFNGCFFQACPTCFSTTKRKPLTDSSFHDLYYRTQIKESHLKSRGFVVRTVWEHDRKEMVENDKGLRAFTSKKEFSSPLVPRKTLFWGQTNAICLYYMPKAAEKNALL